jgi:hypothetical protein
MFIESSKDPRRYSLFIGRYRMLHQSGFEVNAQSTDALDFARRNTPITASKGCPQVLGFEAA